jgi:biuret amidohydrolase
VPESLEDALDARTLAFVIYDMQAGILGQIPDGDRVLSNVLKLIVRHAETPRAYGFHPPLLHAHRTRRGVQLRQAKIWQGKAHASQTRPQIPHGSARFQLADGLQPRPDEAVIDKITMSAFAAIPLDIVLRDCACAPSSSPVSLLR